MLVCYFPSSGEAKYCDDRVRRLVCLSVCFLSANISISEITTPIFRKFLCVLPMALARSSSAGVAIRYVLPVLWMTSYLHIMGHIQGCRCNTDTASQPDGAARRLINFLGPIQAQSTELGLRAIR